VGVKNGSFERESYFISTHPEEFFYLNEAVMLQIFLMLVYNKDFFVENFSLKTL
jgi:hypothetical protein